MAKRETHRVRFYSCQKHQPYNPNKNVKTKILLLATLAALSLFSSAALAQEKSATKLMRLQTPQDLQQVEMGDTIIMTCPKCKDTYTSVVTKPMKGVESEGMKTMMAHMCSSCSTSIKTEGMGKTAKDILVHTCSMCGSADVSCCLMKKDGGPTTGMEEKK